MRYIRDRVVKESGIGRELISLDQSKAFVRVDHRYSKAVFRVASFGPVFCAWIAALYNGFHSVVRANDHPPRTFNITRSVRQGWSPLVASVRIDTGDTTAETGGTEGNPARAGMRAERVCIRGRDHCVSIEPQAY